jgi:hypothetical protein
MEAEIVESMTSPCNRSAEEAGESFLHTIADQSIQPEVSTWFSTIATRIADASLDVD